jgi:hypothetical protein
MNKKEVTSNLKKYLIFTTLISIVVISVLIWDTEEEQIDTPENIVQTDINRCLDIPTDLVADIESWLEITWWWKLVDVKGVKSNDFEERYFISWFLQWEWISENEIVVTFTVDSLDRWKTMIGSVNAFAKEFAVWPTPRIINNSNDWIKQSQECIKK